MKLLQPDPREASVMVGAMVAVASAEGRLVPSRLEAETIAAIQRHMLGIAKPLRDVVPGPLPADLEAALATGLCGGIWCGSWQSCRWSIAASCRRKCVWWRTPRPGSAFGEPGLDILHNASRRRHDRIAFALMKRFVSAFWSSSGKARLRDYGQFIWWMLPRLHGKRTAQRNRALTDRFGTLAELPDGTLGREVHRFHTTAGIPLPGQPSSVPWSLHEVYHVVGEYGLAFHPELLLTAFIGGNQDEACLERRYQTRMSSIFNHFITAATCDVGPMMELQ